MGPLLAEVKDHLVCTQSPHKVMYDHFTDEMLLLIQSLIAYIDKGNQSAFNTETVMLIIFRL